MCEMPTNASSSASGKHQIGIIMAAILDWPNKRLNLDPGARNVPRKIWCRLKKIGDSGALMSLNGKWLTFSPKGRYRHCGNTNSLGTTTIMELEHLATSVPLLSGHLGNLGTSTITALGQRWRPWHHYYQDNSSNQHFRSTNRVHW